MSEFHPNLDTQNEVSNLLDDLVNRLQYLLGVDETIPACEVIDMDPRGVGAGTLPRYIQARIHQYYQEALYRGFPSDLMVGDYITIIHMREGDQYEVLGAGGSTGAVPTDGGVSTPPHFSAGQILLNLTFDHLKFWNDDITQRYGFLTSRRDRAWIWPNSTDYDSRGALSLVPSLWPFRRAFRADISLANFVTNPSFEVDTAGWVTWSCGASRVKEWAWSQIWSVQCLATAQSGMFYFNIAAAVSTGQYSASIWMRADSDEVRLRFRNVTTVTNIDAYHPGDGQWHRLVCNNLTVNIGDNIRLMAQDTRAASWTDFWVDAAQIEPTDYHTPYCDGDLGDGNTWTGVNHATYCTRHNGYINLVDMVSTISERESFAVRCVVQAPYDSDFAYWPVAASPIWDTRGADNNNRIELWYDSTNDVFDVYINGATRLTSSVQTFTEGEWFDIIIKFNFGLYDSYELWINGVQEDTDTTALAAPTLTNWQLGANIVAANYQCGWAFAEYTVYESDSLLTETLIDQLYLTGPTIDPESVLEERTNPPGFWDHTISSVGSGASDVGWVELHGTNACRFLLAGDWATGHWMFEVIGEADEEPADSEVKLQYYDEILAIWQDVPGSLITITAIARDRYLVGPLSMIRSMHEFRVMRRQPSAISTHIYKARVFNSHGGDTAL